MQEEEIKMRRKEQEIKEREQLMKERELEARLKKDEEIIFILKQQLQQQQAIFWKRYSSKTSCFCPFTKVAWKRRNDQLRIQVKRMVPASEKAGIRTNSSSVYKSYAR